MEKPDSTNPEMQPEGIAMRQEAAPVDPALFSAMPHVQTALGTLLGGAGVRAPSNVRVKEWTKEINDAISAVRTELADLFPLWQLSFWPRTVPDEIVTSLRADGREVPADLHAITWEANGCDALMAANVGYAVGWYCSEGVPDVEEMVSELGKALEGMEVKAVEAGIDVDRLSEEMADAAEGAAVGAEAAAAEVKTAAWRRDAMGTAVEASPPLVVPDQHEDQEVRAMAEVYNAIRGLEPAARRRVLVYAMDRWAEGR